jgi:Do/DeqQ family serine protease
VNNRKLRTFGAAAVAAGSIATWSVYGADSTAPAPVVLAAPAGAEARTIGAGIDSYAPVVDRVAPTVVTIRSERRVRPAQQFPFSEDPFFRRFFGDRLPQGPEAQPRREGGLGSGVIVSADGYIVTNHHVVDGAEAITVELTDGRSFEARVIGSDPPSDLAALKIDGGGFPALPLGNSDQVRVGDVVLAVGNPMGVGQTVTMGIISAKGRATGLGDGSFEDFLQTDAPINRGNSGGALVNTRGELVGINSQILSPSGGNIGIGFAIPANMAKSVFQSLVTDGRVHRGMLGVTVQSMTPDLAKSLGLDAVRGALVSAVQPGSAADDAGIERGDVIVAIDGGRIADSNALRNQVAGLEPGTKAELTIVREGAERTVTATLGELPVQATANDAGRSDPSNSGAGLSVEPLTPERARQLGIASQGGLLVTGIDPAGPAADAGFRRGDVILEVDGEPVESAAALRRRLARGEKRPALVLVQRGETTLYLPLTAHIS